MSNWLEVENETDELITAASELCRTRDRLRLLKQRWLIGLRDVAREVANGSTVHRHHRNGARVVRILRFGNQLRGEHLRQAAQRVLVRRLAHDANEPVMPSSVRHFGNESGIDLHSNSLDRRVAPITFLWPGRLNGAHTEHRAKKPPQHGNSLSQRENRQRAAKQCQSANRLRRRMWPKLCQRDMARLSMTLHTTAVDLRCHGRRGVLSRRG